MGLFTFGDSLRRHSYLVLYRLFLCVAAARALVHMFQCQFIIISINYYYYYRSRRLKIGMLNEHRLIDVRL